MKLSPYDRVVATLRRAGCYMTTAAICRIAGMSRSPVVTVLRALEDDERVDVIEVLADKHGAQERRCNAYMLIEGEA
jgi:predicted transcriptional regulator